MANLIIAIIAVIISVIALTISTIVAVKSWHKSRVVYELKEMVLRKVNGSREDSSRGLEQIEQVLSTGKYSVEAILDRKDGDWAVLLARIKK